MSTPDDMVARELARLSATFVAQLPEQVSGVGDELAAWLHTPQDSGRYEVLSHKVHQLKGSGSTFGCPGISRAARTLEQCLGAFRREIEDGQVPAPAAVESAMAALQNEARRAQSDSPDAGESR